MTPRGLAVWFGALLALSVYSRFQVMEARADRCSLDGSRIVPVYRVDLLEDGATTESFCCVRCAREWPDVPEGATWLVRDEVSGRALDAAVACFVESGVVTQAARRDPTHVFERWPDALSHVAEFGGARIRNPFGATSAGPAADRPVENDDEEETDE